MPSTLLKLPLSKSSEIEFFENFLIYKDKKVLYSDIDGIAYLYTKTRHSINFIPVGTSHSYIVSIQERGVVHKMTFSGENNQELFGKLINAIDILIKPFVTINLLLDYVKNDQLEIAGLIIKPEGIYKKKFFGKLELLPWKDFYNSVNHRGHIQIFKRDDKKKYVLFCGPSMSLMNAVVLPDVLTFLFKNEGTVNEEIKKEIIEKKTQLARVSTNDALQDLNKCLSCGEKTVEEAQKFCAKCGAPLLPA